MQSGSLKKRIDIQAPTKVSDGMGGFVTTFKTVASSIPAAIWDVSANEQIQAMQTVMTISCRIRIRYRPIFKASWRIKEGNEYYNIVSIINPNRDNRYLDIMAKKAA